MDLTNQKTQGNHRKMERRFNLLVILYISILTQVKCETHESIESTTKTNNLELDSSHCHTCFSNSNEIVKENLVDNIIDVIYTLTEKDSVVNKTIGRLEIEVENLLERALSKDRYEIVDGIEIKPTGDGTKKREDKTDLDESQGRALFSKYTYEYRMFQKVKEFVNTHVLSINLPKAAKLMGFRSFGINKFLLPLFIGGQVLIKSVLLAMFLPSILGSFGKILGKGNILHLSQLMESDDATEDVACLPRVYHDLIPMTPKLYHSGISQLSASSSQASYPPINGGGEDQTAYNNENKDVMGYETNPAGAYVYPDAYGDQGDANELGNIDMSRFGIPGQQMPSKNSYYQNQMQTANNYKVFQKIPASSMILSNYDPFYSPLLSRLDGIFARLGLSPPDNLVDDQQQIGGQSVHDVKLESCREQLVCLMYASPAKYAPYSNLISAQLSRELNELRRPVSDNPEILRFFRYMRAARRGQEGTDCMQAFPGCATNAAPAHTMIAAYHDINKLVTARKLGKS